MKTFVVCVLAVSVRLTAAEIKQSVEVQVLNSAGRNTRIELVDQNADSCWDRVIVRTTNGIQRELYLVDGLCGAPIAAINLKAEVRSGSLEDGDFEVAIIADGSNEIVGTLYYDESDTPVTFIPSVHYTQRVVQRDRLPIGVQMSINGDRAVVAVAENVHATVHLVQTDSGKTIPLFNGTLNQGTTMMAMPEAITSGAYIFMIATDRGSGSLAFTVQR